MKRPMLRILVLTLCIGGLAACRDNGLADRNLPLAEAQNREFGYAVYEPNPDNTPVAMAGRHWLSAQRVESIPDRLLVPIGTADGTTLYARRGEQAPFATLYAPVSEGRWTPYLRLN